FGDWQVMIGRMVVGLTSMLVAFTVMASVPALASSRAHVYILRGFMGMSPGLDGIADKIKHRGIPTSIANHPSWSGFAEDAIGQYKAGTLRSVIIVGHSLGGGAAIDMATELAAKRGPVQRTVTLDPTAVPQVPSNVRRIINFYVKEGISSALDAPKGLGGRIQNSVEKAPEVGHLSLIAAHERQIIASIVAGAARGARCAAEPHPAAAARH